MSYSANSQKRYNEKSIFITIKYAPKEYNEGIRIKKYIEQSGISANSYIKDLIKKDLDSKGFK